MDIFKQSNLKELQHFKFFLESARSTGLTLEALYKYTMSYISKEKADQSALSTKVPRRMPVPEDYLAFKERCKDCGDPLRLRSQPEVDGSMLVIAECRKCRFSKIVDQV